MGNNRCDTELNSSRQIDALLLCGDKGASRPVAGESKAFLPLKEEPLFYHVLKELEMTSRINRVFLVGDKKRLDTYLLMKAEQRSKPVFTIEQGGSLLENVWNGFIASLDGYEPHAEKTNTDFKERVIFALPCDTPLISSMEINDFFDEADMNRYDYVVGLTDKDTLKKYYPERGKPGIKMAYMYLKEGLFRINNLHLARPFAFANRAAVQELYESRYQKRFSNFIRVVKYLWKIRAARGGLRQYFFMQSALLFSRIGLSAISDVTRRYASMRSVLDAMEKALGLRVGCAVTKRGGAALDIDNEKDYIAIEKMYDHWKVMQKSPKDEEMSCGA